MDRVNVIGSSGTGKTTFARALAARMGCPVVEMDTLRFADGWTPVPDDVMLASLRQAIAGDRWVLDGNYQDTVPVKWARVDTVVWIDTPFPLTLRRIVTRALRRGLGGQEVWPGTGAVESLHRSFASRESVIMWMLQTFRKNRRRFSALMDDPELSHIRFVRLRSPAEGEAWLDGVERR